MLEEAGGAEGRGPVIPYDRSWVVGYAHVLYRLRRRAVTFGQCLSDAHKLYKQISDSELLRRVA